MSEFDQKCHFLPTGSWYLQNGSVRNPPDASPPPRVSSKHRSTDKPLRDQSNRSFRWAGPLVPSDILELYSVPLGYERNFCYLGLILFCLGARLTRHITEWLWRTLLENSGVERPSLLSLSTAIRLFNIKHYSPIWNSRLKYKTKFRKPCTAHFWRWTAWRAPFSEG